MLTLPGGALNYTENAAAAVIDATATVADADSANFDNGMLIADFTANGTADDRLAIRNQGTGAGQIGVSGANVSYNFGAGAVVIGSFSGGSDGSTPLVVTFNANATAASAQALLRNITYANVSDAPSTTPRTVRFVLTDGDGGTSGAPTKTINVTAVNDAPLITTTGSTLAYTENGAAAAVDGGLTLSDADNANLSSATVTISAGFAAGQDTLAFTDQNGISGSWNAGTGVLTLSGSATVANYQAALRSITYVNASDNPSTSTRTVSFVVNDGSANSNTGTRNIAVTAVNDAPTLTATALNPTFTEAAGLGTQAAAVSVFSGAAASTIETGQTISGLTLTVSGLLDGANEVIVIDGSTITLGANSSGTTATNGLAYSATLSGGTATLVLSAGSLSTAAAQTLVNGITYQNTSTDNPSAGNRVFTLTQVKDSGGTANGGVDTTTLSIGSTVAVIAANDAPGGAPVVTGTPTEDQTLAADTSGISDAEGLGAFSYQWQRNGVNIAGATAATYTLGDADVGTNIRVVVSYTDGNGTAESLTSAAVGPVANVNDAPSGAPVVTGTPTEDQTLTANTATIADADGLGAFSYQWQRNGVNIAGANSSNLHARRCRCRHEHPRGRLLHRRQGHGREPDQRRCRSGGQRQRRTDRRTGGHRHRDRRPDARRRHDNASPMPTASAPSATSGSATASTSPAPTAPPMCSAMPMSARTSAWSSPTPMATARPRA